MPISNAPDAELDLMARFVRKAAEARGIATAVKEISGERSRRRNNIWLSFSVDGQEYLYSRGMLLEHGSALWDQIGRNVNHEASLLIANKFGSKKYLEARGFSVPNGYFFRRRNLKPALQAYEQFSGPVCVKPNHGSEGRLVFPSIRDREWYEIAIRRVAERYPNILVEESVEGEHFRFFYVQPRVVGIRCGRPASVVGDGVSTIASLAEAKNAEREHRALPTHPQFAINDDVLEFLARTGRSLNDVPVAGERVFLSGVSNATAGADTFLVWDEIHPTYRAIVAQACQSIQGLFYSGVDIVIRDPARPAESGNHWFLELNASPALTGFYYPWTGEAVDVAGYMIDMLISQRRASKPQNYISEKQSIAARY